MIMRSYVLGYRLFEYLAEYSFQELTSQQWQEICVKSLQEVSRRPCAGDS